MDEPISEKPLMMAAHAVCDAVAAHAQACAGDTSNVVDVVEAGEALVAAVLEYEKRLGAETGWSNPIRHLGRLPQYAGGDQYDTRAGRRAVDVARVRVAVSYLVEVNDEEMVGNLVESGGGDPPPTIEDAVRFLFESDSWDVRRYPPGSVRLIDVDVDISTA